MTPVEIYWLRSAVVGELGLGRLGRHGSAVVRGRESKAVPQLLLPCMYTMRSMSNVTSLDHIKQPF